MNEGWKVLWLFAAVFAAAFGAERTLVPDVVPVAFAEVPQPLWAVGTAVMLRALELMSGSIALIALLLMSGVWAHRLRETQVSWKDVSARSKAATPRSPICLPPSESI
jgi:hypothetical protein